MACGTASPCGVHRGSPLCFSGAVYGEQERAIIWSMKYRGGRSVARRMGRLLAETFGRPAADYLVPIPLHRESRRGYNQAELLARGAGDVWHIPVLDALVWRRKLPRQAVKLSASERTLPDDAISAVQGVQAGVAVFLVDDVYTTGGTMRAAAKALTCAGASVAGGMVWSKSGGKGA